MKPFVSFKQQLIIVYVFFMLLPLSLLGFGAYYLYSEAMEQKLSNFAQQVAVSTAAQIERYIQELERFTLQPYYDPALQDLMTLVQDNDYPTELARKEKIEKQFSFWQSQLDSIENIYFFGLPGQAITRNYQQGFLPPDFRVEDTFWYDAFSHSSDNLAFISLHPPYTGSIKRSADNFQVFSLIRKIYTSNTLLEYSGYFKVDFKLDDIMSIIDAVNVGENGRFFIVDDEQRLVYANPAISGQALAQLPPLEADTGKQYVELDGQNIVLVHSKIGQYGWRVVGEVPIIQIVSGNSGVRNSMVFLGLLCITIAIVISVWISYQITKPIYRLITLIKRVEQEDFQISYNNPPRNEIGHLIRSFIQMSRRLDETIRNLYRAEIFRKNSELQALRSQINPHFLFNTLETIKMKAEIDEADDTVEMLTSLGKLVKSSIYRGNDFITYREEQAYLHHYFQIQQGRFGNRFNIELQVEEQLLDSYLPKLTIQPLVENAFYHGLEMKPGKGRLLVQIAAVEQQVRITVSDDGLGMSNARLKMIQQQLDSEQPPSGNSIGLHNVHARLKLYFDDAFFMQLESKPDQGTTLILHIPLIQSENEVQTYVSRHNRR